METPERIYLQVCGDCPQTDCENCKFEDIEDNVTWWKDKIFDNDIEYIRTDAVVKKAYDAFYKVRCNGKPLKSTCTLLGTCIEYDNFRKVLKGE